MTRHYSAIATHEVQHLLTVIADKSTSHQAYQQAMTDLGQHLGTAMLDAMGHPPTSHHIYLVATAEDADFLASGILKQLEAHLNSVGFACIWNQRTSLFGMKPLAVAPILKQYREPVEQVDTLIVVKSIISGGCVVKTNLQNLIQTLQPQQIFIAAPVLYHTAEASLRQVFPADITNKFRFFYFAQDHERTEQGEVVPGIGGMVYDRLGFNGQSDKNRYTPSIVKQRRQMILESRKF
ncbi:MAG: hypothetical protein VKJ64_07400 [Leptolyngbyaceae bacterium]|nr:hypothetical protein [Leptolyngbyaceae bacterium]